MLPSLISRNCDQLALSYCRKEICHHLLDLLIHAAQNPSATTSPSTPSSPSPHNHASPRPHPSHPSHPAHPLHHVPVNPPPVPYKHDALMRLKIHLRETEHPARPREPPGAGRDASDADTAGLGKNEGTVRFMFGPERLVGSAV